MPKCPSCGHNYISGELHCPECFEPVPIAVAISNEPDWAGQQSPAHHHTLPESGEPGDPFAGLFNSLQTAPPVQPAVIQPMEPADDNRTLFNPANPISSYPQHDAGLANDPIQLEPVPGIPVPRQTTPPPPSGSQAQPRAALLKVTHGQAAGTEFALTPETTVIGRWDPAVKAFVEVDLTAVDVEAKVSRKHARITFADGRYFIEDLGSTNGTYVNRGERLIPGDKVPLNDGDEIILGKTFLKFIMG